MFPSCWLRAHLSDDPPLASSLLILIIYPSLQGYYVIQLINCFPIHDNLEFLRLSLFRLPQIQDVQYLLKLSGRLSLAGSEDMGRRPVVKYVFIILYVP